MDRLYQNLKENKEVRESLIQIKQQLKNGQGQSLRKELQMDGGRLLGELLKEAEPKVRRNAALIIGELNFEELLPRLYAAYAAETTHFIRSDYLKAMSRMDFSPYEQELRERLEELTGQEISLENQKHVREETAALQKMLLSAKRHSRHEFRGFGNQYDVILTTNRLHREITARKLQAERITLVPAGVKAVKAQVRQLLPVRTYRELLFLIPALKTVCREPEEAAAMLAQSGLMEMLEQMHESGGPFYFRLSVAGNMPLDKRGGFIKKCSFAMEQMTGRRLINTPSDYEIEIRLLEQKDGSFYPLMKLFTIVDGRFDYRKESIAGSIHPSTAALLAELAKPCLKEKGQVLDPFCGVGTMLIERDRAVMAGPMYGIDLFGEAVDKARENTKRAGREIYYIHRDFFDFRHEYLFDEIFTNMPVRGKKSREEQDLLYGRFFEQAETLLKPDGTIFLYSNEKGFVKKQLRLHPGMKLRKEYAVSEKDGYAFFVIGQRG